MLSQDLLVKLADGLGEAATKAESIQDPVNWIEKNFYIPETRDDPILKGRLQLVGYQKDLLREIFQKDEWGNFKYSIIVWSDIKKSIKSTIAAAVNLYGTEFSEFGERLIVANDLKQADSRVNYYVRRAIQLSPTLSKKYTFNGYKISAPNGSFMEAIPIDPSGEAGSNADMITFSELWGAKDAEKAKQAMWAEMTLSPTKFGKSFRWIETYAGTAGEAKLLYSLYETGVKRGHLLWPDRLYPVTGGEPSVLEAYVNESARMLCLWNTVPRCPWQSKDYYSSEEGVLLPNQFARMHRNQWASAEETFVPMSWWHACKRTQEEWPIIDKGKHPMVIALDAGVSNDNFGLVMGGRHPQNKDETIIEFSQKWVPPKGGTIDFQGTEEYPGPEMVLRKLIKENNVVQVAYDPYQLHDLATRLKKEGLAWFRPFNQGAERLEADNQYRTKIRERRIWQNGDKDLKEHMENANGQQDDEDRKIRIVKRADELKIDLTVAGSMMNHEVHRLNL